MPAPSCTPARAARASAAAPLHEALPSRPWILRQEPVDQGASQAPPGWLPRALIRAPTAPSPGQRWEQPHALHGPQHTACAAHARRAAALQQTTARRRTCPDSVIRIVTKKVRRCRPYNHAHCAAAAATLQGTTARRRSCNRAVSVAAWRAAAHSYRDNAYDNEPRPVLRRAVVCCRGAAAAAH